MKGLECWNMWHTTPPTSEPVSKSRICKANFSLEQGKIDSCQYTKCWDAQTNQQEMQKSRAFLKFCLLQRLHSPKLEGAVLVFAHSPDKSTCPASGVLLPGMLMEFVFATCWLKEQKNPRIILRAATQDSIFPIGPAELLTSALLSPAWLLHFLLTVALLSTKRTKGSCLPQLYDQHSLLSHTSSNPNLPHPLGGRLNIGLLEQMF